MTPHLELVVDLELDTTPISGRVCTPTRPAREFHGWLELASVIEALRNDAIGAQNNNNKNTHHLDPTQPQHPTPVRPKSQTKRDM